jgi:long-chain acyl-CoA synthetase
MRHEVLNEVLSRAPQPGHCIRFVRLDGSHSYQLTELYAAAGRLAAALTAAGLQPGDRIGVLAANSYEWVLLDLAALRLKLVVAGFEPAKFAAGPALVERYQLSLLFTDRDLAGQPTDDRLRPLSEVTRLAEQTTAEPLPTLRYQPQDEYALKFTSGSSGEPKCLAASVGSIDSSISAIQGLFQHGAEDQLFLFLPLSLLQQRYWIYSALCFGHDVTVSTYEAAFPALAKARPTVVMGVPGFYETAMRHIQARARRIAANGSVTAEQAVRTAAIELFGDRIRYLWTGSAPARPQLLQFFTDAGFAIYEGYGLNETCIVAKNGPGAHRAGSVGRVLAGKQVLFDPDGVISVRSDHPVNHHYAYGSAADSARVFVGDNTVRTGDLGHLDEDGFLYIHGRADDVIVLDNGKKVIVRPIEERLKASAAIEDCVLFCPSQTKLVAVVSPAAGADPTEISEHVAKTNAESDLDEQIARVVVAAEPFSVANGLLSGQFKPRRGQILDCYRSEIHASA